MANIISLQEKVQSKRFDGSNFLKNYKRLPAEKQSRVLVMLMGYYSLWMEEHGIDDATMENIYGTLGEEYQDMLLNMVNEQIVDGGKAKCQ